MPHADLLELPPEDAPLIPAAKALAEEFVDVPPWAELSIDDRHFYLKCVERVIQYLPPR